MKYINYISLAFVAGFALSSCNDYLDAKPQKGDRIELETFDQLEALLSAKMEPSDRQAVWDCNAAQRYMTDCYELTTDYCDLGFEYFEDYTAFQLNCFQPQYTQEIQATNSAWLCLYKNIYLANTVLTYLDEVKGGTPAQKTTLAQRAHFIRAYNYYELANCYCVPYCEANLNELGLPLNTGIEYKDNYSRSSLKEVYDLIEADLMQAVELSIPLTEGGVRKTWRENKAAVNGFAARFYLTKGDYAQAKEYAEKALTCNADIANYNDPGEIAPAEVEDGSYGELHESNTWYEVTMNDMTGLYPGDAQKTYYRRYHFTASWAIPSQKLTNSFDQEYDMRFKYFYYQDYLPLSMAGFGLDYGLEGEIPGYSYFCGDDFDSGPSAAEMVLIKAECMARQGQWNEALSYLNTDFRPYRISSEAPAEAMNLTAANKEEAIAAILKERMLEFPFTLRWHDIRRCNFNEDPNDDVTITREFYELDPTGVHAPLYDNIVEYTLSPKSNKYTYTLAIPASEVTVSQGTIEQNRY